MFAFQDKVIGQIVAAMAVELTGEEQARIAQAETKDRRPTMRAPRMGAPAPGNGAGHSQGHHAVREGRRTRSRIPPRLRGARDRPLEDCRLLMVRGQCRHATRLRADEREPRQGHGSAERSCLCVVGRGDGAAGAQRRSPCGDQAGTGACSKRPGQSHRPRQDPQRRRARRGGGTGCALGDAAQPAVSARLSTGSGPLALPSGAV